MKIDSHCINNIQRHLLNVFCINFFVVSFFFKLGELRFLNFIENYDRYYIASLLALQKRLNL